MSGAKTSKEGWLEIVQEEGSDQKRAFCPYRDRTVDASLCFACRDCSGLALSPSTRSYYVVCERAANDHLWVEGGTETRPVTIHRCDEGGDSDDGKTRQA